MKGTKKLLVAMLTLTMCLMATAPAIAAVPQGSHGEEVVKLQEALAAEGYDITVDGDYGPGTDTAVEEFRKSHGLEAEGGADDAMLSILYANGIFKEYTEMLQKYENKEVSKEELTNWLEDSGIYDAFLIAQAGLEAVTSDQGTAEVEVEKLSDFITDSDLTNAASDGKGYVSFNTLVEKAQEKLGRTVDEYIDSLDDTDKLSAASNAIKAVNNGNDDVIAVVADLISPFLNGNKIANRDDAIENELNQDNDLKEKVERLCFVLEAATADEEITTQQPSDENLADEETEESNDAQEEDRSWGDVLKGIVDSAVDAVKPSNGVTLENFNKIDGSMTYEDVCALFGEEGELLSEVDIGIAGYETQLYAWYDWTGIYNCTITFQGGYEVSKSQIGLE